MPGHGVLADMQRGCDVSVVLAGRVYGKPADRAEAERMLDELSGSTHTVVSGLCLLGPGYEAVATCLASPDVRARTEGVIAWRPQVA